MDSTRLYSRTHLCGTGYTGCNLCDVSRAIVLSQKPVQNAMGMLENGTRAEQLNCLGQALAYCTVQEALICTSTAPQALIHIAYYVMSCVRIAPSAGMLHGISELSSIAFTLSHIYSFSLFFRVLLLRLPYLINSCQF